MEAHDYLLTKNQKKAERKKFKPFMDSVVASNGAPLDKIEVRFTKLYERGVFAS